MFHSARLKLTAWYLLIIMIISVFFSIAFYHSATREIQIIIKRVQLEQLQQDNGLFILRRGRPLPTLEELETIKRRLRITLGIINGFILVFAGGAAYLLAGRTLKPIKEMIDEQNQFISSASHELRTPIATLRAEMEGSLLEKHISDTEARKLIKSNLEELGTLQDLSNTLLRLAQVHDVQAEEYLKEIAIDEVIVTAQKKILPLAKKKNITFTNISKKAIIHGDKSSLTEVFVILLDNAIKYSPENTRIRVAVEDKDKSVQITVADEGIGIAEKDLPHIFERFYRADQSRSQAEGYGLGLSIAKKIIETHNGSIAVQSKLGIGTTFIIQFPLQLE